MTQTEIKKLFEKYLDKQLSLEEFIELKYQINQLNDNTIENNLEELWTSYQSKGNRNKQAFECIKKNLNKAFKHQQKKDRKRSIFFYTGKVASIVFIFLLMSFTAYLYFDRATLLSDIKKEYTVSVGKGEKARLILPDNTIVYLNSQSSLTCAASFASSHRKVSLAGEAYFEVQEDTSKPFLVQTQEVNIEVLGTTFNVKAYPDSPNFEASLVEGKIKLIQSKNYESATYLYPNQKARYSYQTGQMELVATDLWLETAWRRGDLVFYSQTIAQIFNQLEFFYGISIATHGNFPKDLFTGSFHEEHISTVLKNLQEHYRFSFQRVGNEIEIKF
ncbi:hypothetical protein AwDysgo_11570 [Bacteroidales bacterium]|nr:hypothetical protein AwDysgo_11570 [Bacteroidales bacterium]